MPTPQTRTLATTCCIVGGGPAGMMLGYLLARSGVQVTVLEKHKDFFRDFRGDTIHPSTLQLLHELGLLDRFLQIPHAQVTSLSAIIGGRTFRMADFSHLPTIAKFIALMPQWDFLNFLAHEASAFPNFTLHMQWEATDLLRENSRITGVIANTPEGPVEIAADLTIGCDGRHATSRAAAHLNVVEQGVPIDVLWFHIPRQPTDPENALGYVNYGRALILINRTDYFQAGFIIAKGIFPGIQQRGLQAFRASIEQLAPFLAGRTASLDSWDKIKLLTVQINHLQRWSLPGLLCIGDAAHAMSPVGGIGINIALQDAVAAANILAGPLRTNTLTDHHLQWVQQRRAKAVLRTQRIQAFAHRIMNKVLHHEGPLKPPLLLRLVTSIPGFQRLTGRFVGIGLQPEHPNLTPTRLAHPQKPSS
jgi:2-polyprenyl-6-methoxyphenol hydroxylase-like FAD-dependent oxidoreductase